MTRLELGDERRAEIAAALAQHGPLTAAQVGHRTYLTAAGARYHLLAMEAAGTATRDHTQARPAPRWALTNGPRP